MGSGAGAKNKLQGAFFISLFKDYLSGAIPKYKTIDGTIERLNRKTLTTIFIILAVISTQDGLLGARIHCSGFETFTKKRFVKDYCWTQGLFTTRYGYDTSPSYIPGPGIVPCIRAEDGMLCSRTETLQSRVYHLYYQWVPLYLSLSALALYLPHIVTKVSVIGSLSSFIDVLQETASPQRMGAMLGSWCKENLKCDVTTPFLLRYRVVLVELLSKVSFLATTTLHFLLTGKMFRIGNYYKLGILWHVPESDNYTHIGDVLFPKLVGCRIQKYSTSGLSEESGMCTLAPNVVFQYLFLVTWWCITILTLLNFLNILKTLYTIICHSCGCSKIQRDMEISYTNSRDGTEGLLSGANKQDIDLIFRYYDFSSQLILYKVSDNVHPAVMTYGIRCISKFIKDIVKDDPKYKAVLDKSSKGKGKGKGKYTKIKNTNV